MTPADDAQSPTPASDRWALRRMRHDIRRRDCVVETVERLSPGMLRLVFRSPDLTDFPSASPDDHVKLMIPGPGGETIMRDYTPRAFDRTAGRLVIDFAVHDAGPATAWALAAKVGDTLVIGGPRGSTLLPEAVDWLVVIGDETALPAIGRRVEESPEGLTISGLAIVETQADVQTFETPAAWSPHWVLRDQVDVDDAAALIARLDEVIPKAGEGFFWVAAEARVARALRAHLIEVRGVDPRRIKAAGYWIRGAEGAHEPIE
ncbi:MAG: siderophore-interacting protein [Caulobacter sp.]|nr:siderophore-interacting protein [Caulobacter sp.]